MGAGGGEVAATAYILLRRTLEETRRSAVVKFTLRQKTRLGTLRVRDEALVLQSLLWDDEVREPEFAAIASDVRISDAELAMAQMLVDQFSSDFTPEAFVDEYQLELRALIEDKIRRGEVAGTEAPPPAGDEQGEVAEVIDLMEALRRSVERTKQRGGPSVGTSG